MKTIIIVGGIALSAALSAPVEAAEFTGPRIEAQVGYDRLDVDSTAFKLDQHRDGIAYGIGVGYDVALGKRVIAGIEANATLSNVDFRSISGTTTVEAEADRDFEVSARLGAKLTDNVLVYGKAGYTNARLKGAILIGGTTGTTRTEFEGNGDGLRVGGGFELAFGRNAYGKVEYRYSNYEGGVSRHQAVTGLGFRF